MNKPTREEAEYRAGIAAAITNLREIQEKLETHFAAAVSTRDWDGAAYAADIADRLAAINEGL